jgi:hypothetical protein
MTFGQSVAVRKSNLGNPLGSQNRRETATGTDMPGFSMAAMSGAPCHLDLIRKKIVGGAEMLCFGISAAWGVSNLFQRLAQTSCISHVHDESRFIFVPTPKGIAPFEIRRRHQRRCLRQPAGGEVVYRPVGPAATRFPTAQRPILGAKTKGFFGSSVVPTITLPFT